MFGEPFLAAIFKNETRPCSCDKINPTENQQGTASRHSLHLQPLLQVASRTCKLRVNGFQAMIARTLQQYARLKHQHRVIVEIGYIHRSNLSSILIPIKQPIIIKQSSVFLWGLVKVKDGRKTLLGSGGRRGCSRPASLCAGQAQRLAGGGDPVLPTTSRVMVWHVAHAVGRRG